MGRPSFLVLGDSDLVRADLAPFLLGRLCANPDEPTADYAIENPQPFYTQPPSVISLAKTTAVSESIKDEDARMRLGKVFNALLAEGSKSGFAISAQSIRTFKLMEQEKVLGKIWADHKARHEIKDLMKQHSKLYMIVGLKTCINADIGYLQQHQLSARLSVSVTEALALLSGAELPVPPWLDIIIEAGGDKSKTLVQTAQLFGEAVFAVRYREVTRRSVITRCILRDELDIGEKPMEFPNGNTVFAPGDVSQIVDDQLDMDKWQGLGDDDIPEDEEDDLCIVPYEKDPDLTVKKGVEVDF
jgi:hypothetical protein